jgi:hypothetical protein
VYGQQHQDVSGHHQTHLGWAKGQSGQEKNKAAVLLYCRLAKQPRVMLGPLVAGFFFYIFS